MAWIHPLTRSRCTFFFSLHYFLLVNLYNYIRPQHSFPSKRISVCLEVCPPQTFPPMMQHYRNVPSCVRDAKGGGCRMGLDSTFFSAIRLGLNTQKEWHHSVLVPVKCLVVVVFVFKWRVFLVTRHFCFPLPVALETSVKFEALIKN